MSAPKHTPGPWEIKFITGIGGSIVGGVTRQYARGTAKDQLAMVCAVDEDNGGPGAQEANARLIAAAPRLLKACQKALSMTTDPRWGQWTYMEGPDVYEDLRNAADALRVAISEATGEQA